MPTELKGVTELRFALKNFEPDLAKETQKQMAGFLKPITIKARGYMKDNSPLSGWALRSMSEARFPMYNGVLADKGISYKTTPTKPNLRGFSYAASLHNKTAIGAIYETAGRTNPQGQPWVGRKGKAGHRYSHSNNPNAGRQFIAALDVMKGKGVLRGRALFRAWDEDQGRANAAIIKAMEAAAAKFKSKKGI